MVFIKAQGENMFGFEILDLKRENGKRFYENGKRFYYDKIRIHRLMKEIEDFIEEEPFLDDFNFSRKMILSLEIKTNNSIEGLNDDINSIEEAIKSNNYQESNKRILNLYYAYRYILLNRQINKETIKKLYGILSKDLLDDYAQSNMGEYYRNRDVYILSSRPNQMLLSYEKGIDPEKIEEAMNDLLQYMNQLEEKTPIETFIHSQIIHFYFVYIHPYYDVNGRTARTLSLWYLLRKKAYPFVIFNRGISLSKGEYKHNVKKSYRGNITPFLEYVLKTLKKELEKEKIIYNIRTNFGESLSKSEYEILEYVLTVKTHKIQDIIKLYLKNNSQQDREKVLLERIYPLIEKGILIINEEEQTLKINKNFITIDNRKVKKLRIKSYLSE